MARFLSRALPVVALGLVVFTASTAQGQTATTPIYNFQFEAGNFNGDSPTPYSGTAALSYGGATFNHIVLPGLSNPTITLTNAVDSNGVASTVGLTVASPSSQQFAYSSGPAGPTDARTLLSQYLYDGFTGNINNFQITNLPALSAYKLYLYGGDGFVETKGTVFSVLGGTADGGINTTTAAQITSFAEGVNYVLFTGITDASGTVQGTYQGNGSGGVDPFNGLQINVASPVAVPEPGSIALLTGMGMVGAGFLRRRKSASKAA